MATSDVTIAQDGGGNVKLHPYLVTLVRWCVSCLWSTATVLLHRLMTAPLQPITGPKPQFIRSKLPKRAAGTEHLHPEPKVDCQLLHQPLEHTHDVIFVHGLYGSLGNTWRQGDWRPKYRNEPKKVILRNHSTKKECSCNINEITHNHNNITDNSNDITIDNNVRYYNMTFNNMAYDEEILQNNNLLTENFYNNTLMDQVEIIDNYETQANFVRDLFKKECENCEKSTAFDDYFNSKSNHFGDDDDSNNMNYYNNDSNSENFDFNKSDNLNNKVEKSNRYFKSDILKNSDEKNCTYYNSDNVKNSDNRNNYYYNSDRVNNTEDKNTSYLVNVNSNIDNKNDPYFESDKVNNVDDKNTHYFDSDIKSENSNNSDNQNTTYLENSCLCADKQCEVGCGCNCDTCYSTCWPRDWIKQDFPGARVISINYTSDPYLWRPLWIGENKRLSLHERAEQMISQLLSLGVGDKPIIWVGHSKGGLFIKQIYCEAYEAYKKLHNISNENEEKINEHRINEENMNEHVKNEQRMNEHRTNEQKLNEHVTNSMNEQTSNEMFDDKCNLSMEDECKTRTNEKKEEKTNASSNEAYLKARSSLWIQSKGFMFYSVPHRGSPLADIKTPVTARSVELLEISKDCELVLDLQSRWLAATSIPRPPVHSFVETCRTLMSVLWLRIVSVDSADAGIGTLVGVSVDHREICKPSSRKCILYTELTDLMRRALSDCKC